jgi:hypothetical protein
MIMPIERNIIRNSIWECRTPPTRLCMPAIEAFRPDDVSDFEAKSVFFVFHKYFPPALLIQLFDRPGGSLRAEGFQSPSVSNGGGEAAAPCDKPRTSYRETASFGVRAQSNGPAGHSGSGLTACGHHHPISAQIPDAKQ